MADFAIHYSNLTRICEFARALHQLHHGGGDDEVLEREFNAVCRANGATTWMTLPTMTCRRRTMRGSIA
jgi:hypothetical protein